MVAHAPKDNVEIFRFGKVSCGFDVKLANLSICWDGKGVEG